MRGNCGCTVAANVLHLLLEVLVNSGQYGAGRLGSEVIAAQEFDLPDRKESGVPISSD